MLTIPCTIRCAIPQGTARQVEPLSCGVPFPRGMVTDAGHLRLESSSGETVPIQVRVLGRWSDSSIRWVLICWSARLGSSIEYQLRAENSPSTLSPPFPAQMQISDGEMGIEIDTGRFVLTLDPGSFPFAQICTPKHRFASSLIVRGDSDRMPQVHVKSIAVLERGPLRAVAQVSGVIAQADQPRWAEFELDLTLHAASPVVQFTFTIRNPRRAAHPGGIWTLGDSGSILLRELAFRFDGVGLGSIACSPELNQPFTAYAAPFEIYQDSSGGKNWRSRNHLNRNHQVPISFQGYQIRSAGRVESGKRATPIVTLAAGDGCTLGIAVEHFWQNFPQAITATEGSLAMGLFPGQFSDLHELQGGEQKTFRFAVTFGQDDIGNEPLEWIRDPTLATVSPEWICSTGVVPYLTPQGDDPSTDYLALVERAIEGPDSFEAKREAVDEYGWRHFGDIYGDHEAAFHQGPEPLLSHYNNQYDPIAGFAEQYLRSGDRRWYAPLRELAWHVIDIDIYHTLEDKTAYNHGLFWHTIHYIDADTANHRTYPRLAGVHGGGPSSEHAYATGLALYHFLTGDRQAYRAAVQMAEWMIDMDDGRKSIFRWLDRGWTGLASSSGSPLYHGPGRGSGNAVNVLLDGYLLTENRRFLEKAEQLIRRVAHPRQDIEPLNLLDTERKWFYTMFLQALGRYLDVKIERNEIDRMYSYGRQTLLHFARWMAEHEYPYLDKPQKLEYPTETWAAQDMRKSEVFKYATKHATGDERSRFWERAQFFFEYSIATVTKLDVRAYCRPQVLMLRYGWTQAFFARHLNLAAPTGDADVDFSSPTVFVPQKVRAKRRAKAILAGFIGVLACLGAWLLYHCFR